MEDKHHIYAIENDSGKLRHISEVESGNDCGCICADPRCNQLLCAKKGNVLKHHFSHQKSTGCTAGRNGGGARESVYHYCLKEAIHYSGFIPLNDSLINYETWDLLGYRAAINESRLMFSEAQIEKRLREHCVNLQPDVTGVIKDQKVAIEITYTHETSDIKIDQLLSLGIETIEITLKRNVLPDIDELVEKRREKDWEGLLRLFKPFINIQWPSRWLAVERLMLSVQVLEDTKSELFLLQDSYDIRLRSILKERDSAIEKIHEMEAEKEIFSQQIVEQEKQVVALSAEKSKLHTNYCRAIRDIRHLKSHILDEDKNFDFDKLHTEKEKQEALEAYWREFCD